MKCPACKSTETKRLSSREVSLAPGLMAKKTVYSNFSDVNKLQTEIMRFIDAWGHENKTPIPLRLIIENMKKEGIMVFTTIKAINSLLRKGYIRRAYTISNKTYFVQLRRV